MSTRDRTGPGERPAGAPASSLRARGRSEATDRTESIRAADLARPATLSVPAVRHLQRAAGNSATAALLEGVEQSDLIPGPGQPLDDAFASRMSAAFGTDFADVRVHSGSDAASAAAALQARAYTIGSDIVQGESGDDDRTMAHELAHVIQQRGAPAAGPSVARLSISDPGDELERAAESTAESVAGSGMARTVGSGVSGAASTISDMLGLPGVPGKIDELTKTLGGLFG